MGLWTLWQEVCLLDACPAAWKGIKRVIIQDDRRVRLAILRNDRKGKLARLIAIIRLHRDERRAGTARVFSLVQFSGCEVDRIGHSWCHRGCGGDQCCDEKS